MAIGNLDDFDSAASAGVSSAKERFIPIEARMNQGDNNDLATAQKGEVTYIFRQFKVGIQGEFR
ncbi:hypothetical protein ABD76_21570 [Paenibacillus dendritiformis]|uniref:hypothetical protein n=1 Tax=Paenibacillus dendritiformis TaxID=130049 RepID=UPI0018CE88AF|nr:hypothetical protein [Paenibacillus dendritiformis]MBG9794923.1 hypothetical protein [Paenibacillus dendritiformis]